MSSARLATQWSLLSDDLSEAVQKEIAHNRQSAVEHQGFLEDSRSLEEYLASDTSVAPKEYPVILAKLPRGPLILLDIGVGRGESSLYLASQGHDVYAVEPSEDFCEVISEGSKKFKTPLRVVQGVAEDLDKLEGQFFDAAIFNSSLHHCDDPAAALSNCYRLLKPGGHIFLSSELHMHPWITKERWNHRLRKLQGTGAPHIGNEHGYYNWNYVQMLNAAGFTNVVGFPSVATTDPLFRLERRLSQRKRGERQCSALKFMFLAIYYVLTAQLVRLPWAFKPLAYSSILACQFAALRPINDVV